MEGPLAAVVPRWFLDGGQQLPRQANGTPPQQAALIAMSTVPTALVLAPPGGTAPSASMAVGFQRYLLAEEDLTLRASGPMDNELHVTVPGSLQLVYYPRQMLLQRVSAALQMPINFVGTRRECSVSYTALISIKLAASVPGEQPVDIEFMSDPMLSEYTTVEDAAERVLNYLRTSKNIWIDDANHKQLMEKNHMLFTAESFQMLHQEAAEDAIANADTVRQAFIALLQEHSTLRQEHDGLLQQISVLQHKCGTLEQQQSDHTQRHEATLRQLTLLQHTHAALEQQHTILSGQHSDLSRQHGSLTQQNAVFAQQNNILKQRNTDIGQDLENTRHQHQLLLQSHGSLEQAHNALRQQHTAGGRRYNILRCRYDDAIQRAETMALNSPSILPINHRNVVRPDNNHGTVPVYAGPWPPETREHKLAFSLIRLSDHRRATERALLG